MKKVLVILKLLFLGMLIAMVSCSGNEPKPSESQELKDAKKEFSDTRVEMGKLFPAAKAKILSDQGKANFDTYVTNPVTKNSAVDSAMGMNRYYAQTSETFKAMQEFISADSVSTVLIAKYNKLQTLQK